MSPIQNFEQHSRHLVEPELSTISFSLLLCLGANIFAFAAFSSEKLGFLSLSCSCLSRAYRACFDTSV